LVGSMANAINNAGVAVGYAGNTDTHAIVWNGATPTDLSAINGNAGVATAINNHGQVVGSSYPSGVSGLAQATVWNGTTPTFLGTLGGTTSIAYGVNNSGVIVGQSSINPQGTGGAFIWQNGTMSALGTVSGTLGSIAYAINNAELVVGSSNRLVGERVATLWNGSLSIDLNTLLDSSGTGWELADALDINDLGQIVGWGFNPLDQQEAFLLTPCDSCVSTSSVPEPSTAIIFGGGLLGLFLFPRRLRHFTSSSTARRRSTVFRISTRHVSDT
jgi:probable HAF family extracellular repeat protein